VIILTSDTDWVPDKVLDYFLDILDEYDAKATIFATNKVSCRNHEAAIHPYPEISYDKQGYARSSSFDTVENLKKVFPQALGTRSHGLIISTDLLMGLPVLGIGYDSTYLLTFQNNIRPYNIYPGLLEIPIHWMDIEIMRFGKSLRLDNDYLRRQERSKALYVYDFHPSHVFTNTFSLDFYYDVYKPHYTDLEYLEGKRNRNEFGTEDTLIQLLEVVDRTSLKVMKDIYLEWNEKMNKK